MAKGPTVSTTFNAKDKVSGPMKKMQGNMKKFATVAGIGITAAAVGLGKLIKEASKIEDAVAGFTPLLGGVEKANELVDALNKTAASTPFQFEAISAAAKQLLPVMNQDIERTTETFRMLGDTAGGNAQKLETITRGFTKAMLKGKVDMESLNMIAEAGVPIYSELADSMGVSVQEMMNLSSAGKISSEDLEDAFKNMTKEGGIFFDGMAIASKTLTGRLSTLKDNIALTAAALGKTLLPVVKPLVDQMITLAGTVREWVEANQGLIQQNITAFIDGIVRTAKVLVRLWDSGLIPALLAAGTAWLAITKLIAGYQAAVILAKGAQLAFNGAMTASPIGLMIASATALLLLLDQAEKKFGLGQKVVDEYGGGVGSREFEEGRRARLAGRQAAAAASDPRRARLMSRNEAALSGTTNSSELSVNFNNAPAGTSFQQKGSAPGITVDTGRRGGL